MHTFHLKIFWKLCLWMCVCVQVCTHEYGIQIRVLDLLELWLQTSWATQHCWNCVQALARTTYTLSHWAIFSDPHPTPEPLVVISSLLYLEASIGISFPGQALDTWLLWTWYKRAFYPHAETSQLLVCLLVSHLLLKFCSYDDACSENRLIQREVSKCQGMSVREMMATLCIFWDYSHSTVYVLPPGHVFEESNTWVNCPLDVNL